MGPVGDFLKYSVNKLIDRVFVDFRMNLLALYSLIWLHDVRFLWFMLPQCADEGHCLMRLSILDLLQSLRAMAWILSK